MQPVCQRLDSILKSLFSQIERSRSSLLYPTKSLLHHSTQHANTIPNPIFYVHSHGAVLISHGGSRCRRRFFSDHSPISLSAALFSSTVWLVFSTSIPIFRSDFAFVSALSSSEFVCLKPNSDFCFFFNNFENFTAQFDYSLICDI